MPTIGEITARLTLDMSDFSRHMQMAQMQMDHAGHSAHNTGIAFDVMQQSALAFAAVVAASFTSSVMVAANFEQKMKDVQAVSGVTGEELQKLSDLALDMGQKTAFSASESASAIEELIKAGVSVTDILNGGLEGALNLAVAGNLDLASAAEIASTALNAFRKDNLTVAQAADILAGAANASATDIGEMKYGLQMASAVASSVGMSFKDTSTALAVFAQNGLKGSDAGTSLKTMLMNLQPATKAQVEAFRDLGLMSKDGSNAFFTQEGHLKSLAEISEILRNSMSKMTDQQRLLTMETIFGSDAIRASNILFKEGAQGVNEMWAAMSKVTAADVAKTKMETLKGAFEQFKGALETAGIELGNEFLPALTQFTRIATGVVQSLNNVDMANVSAALAFGGTAAAIAVVGSSIMKLVGYMRLLFVSMGPAGWIITGLSIIGGLLAANAMQQKELDDSMLDNLKTQLDSAKAIDANVKAYDDLRSKSHLTNEELAQFVDINTELSKTTDPKRIAELTAVQEQLRQKSGLSNEELDKMVQLNGDLVQKVPEATKTITDQGNAIINNTDAIKKYSAAKLDSLYKELDLERIKNETLYNNLLKQESELVDKRKTQEDNLQKLMGLRDTAQVKLNEAEAELNRLKESGNANDKAMVFTQQNKVQLAKEALDSYQKQLEAQAASILQTGKDLDNTREKIQKLQSVRDQMAQIALAQVGLNSKTGEELSTIDAAIGKLQQQKQELQNTTPAAQRNTQEYRDSVSAIDAQIGKLQSARNQVIMITDQAARMNDELSRDITKRINEVHYQQVVEIVSQGRRVAGGPQSAYHTGGIVGVGQMPKLHIGGLASQFADLPNHNEVDVRLLRNEMVLTQAQQANLMRMIDAGFTNNHGNQKQEKSTVYNVNVDAKNVDVDEQQLTRYLQRLEALYG
jgi:TP901 family phage tail tape measure protein